MLHIKHRPQSWGEIIGNTVAVRYLQSTTNNKDRPHSYLLSGPTGCGKTTMARIFAKELGCKGTDLQEVDVADYRGIDSVREIRQRMHLSPMMGECRVWILDECHRLTADAQAALLKALEDTPAHVYFMLCTTDPHKLVKTIRNRCTPCEVRNLTEAEMKKLLLRTYRSEVDRGTEIDKDAVTQICEAADGCPRQALVLLEKHLADPDAPISAITENTREVIELCRALIRANSWTPIRNVLVNLKGQEPESIRRAVLGYAAAVLLKRENQRAVLILDVFKDNFYDSGWPGLVWACAICIQK